MVCLAVDWDRVGRAEHRCDFFQWHQFDRLHQLRLQWGDSDCDWFGRIAGFLACASFLVLAAILVGKMAAPLRYY